MHKQERTDSASSLVLNIAPAARCSKLGWCKSKTIKPVSEMTVLQSPMTDRYYKNKACCNYHDCYCCLKVKLWNSR